MKFAAALRSLAIACLLLACSPAVFAQNEKGPAWGNLPDFSATEIRGSLSWKIHHSGSKLRVEASSAFAAVYLPDEDKVYHLLILPGRTTCIEMKTAQSRMMPSALQLAYGSNADKKQTGKEVVDGHPATVQEGTTTGPMGESARFKIWTADDLRGVPLRIELYLDRGIMQASYQDITLGSPDPGLFKSPVKCIPPEKMYQVAPASAPPPPQKPTHQETPNHKPE